MDQDELQQSATEAIDLIIKDRVIQKIVQEHPESRNLVSAFGRMMLIISRIANGHDPISDSESDSGSDCESEDD